MKKLFILAAALFAIGTVSAQKLARINVQEVVMAMPEFEQAQKNLDTFGKDLQEQMEQIQVEFNNLYVDYEKNRSTYNDAVRQLKERELQELQQRFSDFQQLAQQDIQKKEADLMAPIYDKADAAVKKVAAAGGYAAVFNTAGDVASSAGLAYFDPAQIKDITADVKKELGIKE